MRFLISTNVIPLTWTVPFESDRTQLSGGTFKLAYLVDAFGNQSHFDALYLHHYSRGVSRWKRCSYKRVNRNVVQVNRTLLCTGVEMRIQWTDTQMFQTLGTSN